MQSSETVGFLFSVLSQMALKKEHNDPVKCHWIRSSAALPAMWERAATGRVRGHSLGLEITDGDGFWGFHLFYFLHMGTHTHTHTHQSYYLCRGQEQADNGIRASRTCVHEVWLIHYPHPNDSVLWSSPHPWSIQMSELVVFLLVPSIDLHVPLLYLLTMWDSPTFSPDLSLHPNGLTEVGEIFRWGLAGQGTMEAQAEAGDPWRDNGLVRTSPLSQLLALS